MFEKVIIGIDGRGTDRDAIRLARELVSRYGTLTLAHVNVNSPVYAKGMIPVLEEEERQRGHQLLRDASTASGIESIKSISAKSVGRGLHELVEHEGADLLVIGSTHRGIVGRVLVGSDTRNAINGAPCAVAIAPCAYADAPDALREIGVAYNETEEAKHALGVARKLAAVHHAKLSVFEAVSLPIYLYYGYGLPYGDVAQDTLEGAQKALARIDGVEAHAAFGDPAEELTLYSASIDLLVVGSRGFGPLGRLVHSSTSVRLASSARCPLLILTRAGRTGEADTVDPDARSHAPITAVV